MASSPARRQVEIDTLELSDWDIVRAAEAMLGDEILLIIPRETLITLATLGVGPPFLLEGSSDQRVSLLSLDVSADRRRPVLGVCPAQVILCDHQEKEEMTCGVAVSNPTTSNIPESFGSAIVKSLATMPTTTSLASIPMFWR